MPTEPEELGLAALGEFASHTEATHGARRRSSTSRGEGATATSTSNALLEVDDEEGSSLLVNSGPSPLAPLLALDPTFAISDLGPVPQGTSLEAVASLDWFGATEPQLLASRLQSSHASELDGQASDLSHYVTPLAAPRPEARQVLEPAAKMKRATELEKGGQEADGDGRRKKTKRGPVDAATPGEGGGKKFACPYFKRNPKKYRNWTSCPGPGWDEVHRVKSARQTACVLPTPDADMFAGLTSTGGIPSLPSVPDAGRHSRRTASSSCICSKTLRARFGRTGRFKRGSPRSRRRSSAVARRPTQT